MQRGNVFGRVCLSVFPVHALTFDSLHLETSFWYRGTFSEYLGQVRLSSLLGQGQGHRSKKADRGRTITSLADVTTICLLFVVRLFHLTL